MNKSQKKIAIYGGSFDPIHNGHLEMACAAALNCHLSELYFVVAKQSPGKSDSSINAESRFNLVERAISNLDVPGCSMYVSRIELDRNESPSYAYETIQSFQYKFPKAKLFWILGLDAYLGLDEWKNPTYIKKNISFIVCPRKIEDRKKSKLEKLKSETETYFLETPKIDISSQEIRELIKDGKAIQDWLPKSIYEDILKLYS